jgi:hyperosmotically inducible periplasmic protein
MGVARVKEGSMKAVRLQRLIPALIIAGGVVVGSGVTLGAQTPADNTKVNTRDRAPGAVTADQQKTNAADQKLTQTIRKSLVQDKSLSSYAHNVKVVTQSGQVTLKGPVRSDDEKRAVEAKAVAAAGEGHVTNELSVAPPKTAKQ